MDAMFLFADISFSWLQELPKGKGPRRSNMLMSLKRRGITQEASRVDAHHAAHQILSLFLFAVGLVSHRLEQYLRKNIPHIG
jgi:hypothetical protein